MKKIKKLLSALLVAGTVVAMPLCVSAEVGYTIDRVDRSWYDWSGNLILTQYFDKVVIHSGTNNVAKINNSINNECEFFLKDAQANIETAKGFAPYGGLSNYANAEVTSNDDKILSVKMTSYWCMGGTGSEIIKGLNYNLNTGEKLSLTDVFSLSTYETEKYIKEETINYINNNPNYGWWNDRYENAKDIVNSKSLSDFEYYVQGNNVYICYPVYELGPGSMGSVVVPCPIDVNSINDRCIYTSNGLCIASSEKLNDYRLSSIYSPGAMVEADYSMFDKLLVYSPENEYSCFASRTGSETLTLGTFYNPNRNSDKQALQSVVAKQIQYIKSIGGVMTGYTFANDGTGRDALNISWNVGGMHHFARFELSTYNKISIGYYDLMFNDSSNVNINHMNNSFSVLVEWQ